MHENSGNSVIYYAHYTEGGVNKTGLTVTITVYEVIRDGTKTEVVTDGACTEIGDGLYRYLLASGTVDAAAEYVAVFHTATDTVDAQDIPAIWVIDRAGTEKLDTGITLADDAITAASLKADAVTEIQSGLATSSALATVDGIVDDILVDTSTTLDGKLNTIDTNVDSILADTGTDGMVVASGQTVATVTNLTNLPTMPADWVTASGLKADAVTEIQSGLALEATLTEIKAKTDNLPADPAAVGSAMTLTAAYDKAKDDVLTPLAVVDGIVDGLKTTLDNVHDTDLPAVKTDTAAIKAKTDNLPANTATALAAIQDDLDNPDQYKADVSGLATTIHVQEVENKIDAIDVTVNTIPTNPLLDTAYTAPDNAGIAAIQEKTEQLTFTAPNKVDASADVVLSPEAIEGMASAIGEGLAEEIWSSSIRTLTQSPAEIIATVLGADITQIRGNSWAVQLTGVELESIQQLAIKHSAKQSDSVALLFVDSINGLTVLNGVAQDGEDSSKASLTYDGTILTLTVDASITAQLPAGSLQYGIQSISNNGIVSEPYGGTFRVLADIVRATD